ncbi:MAG: hypothetical protein LQ340_003129 [Diploschistes diacapsis]|nr:MAG: hypothetical protein LQ340_003129 [Diploschistes diacapsis]
MTGEEGSEGNGSSKDEPVPQDKVWLSDALRNLAKKFVASKGEKNSDKGIIFDYINPLEPTVTPQFPSKSGRENIGSAKQKEAASDGQKAALSEGTAASSKPLDGSTKQEVSDLSDSTDYDAASETSFGLSDDGPPGSDFGEGGGGDGGEEKKGQSKEKQADANAEHQYKEADLITNDESMAWNLQKEIYQQEVGELEQREAEGQDPEEPDYEGANVTTETPHKEVDPTIGDDDFAEKLQMEDYQITPTPPQQHSPPKASPQVQPSRKSKSPPKSPSKSKSPFKSGSPFEPKSKSSPKSPAQESRDEFPTTVAPGAVEALHQLWIADDSSEADAIGETDYEETNIDADVETTGTKKNSPTPDDEDKANDKQSIGDEMQEDKTGKVKPNTKRLKKVGDDAPQEYGLRRSARANKGVPPKKMQDEQAREANETDVSNQKRQEATTTPPKAVRAKPAPKPKPPPKQQKQPATTKRKRPQKSSQPKKGQDKETGKEVHPPSHAEGLEEEPAGAPEPKKRKTTKKAPSAQAKTIKMAATSKEKPSVKNRKEVQPNSRPLSEAEEPEKEEEVSQPKKKRKAPKKAPSAAPAQNKRKRPAKEPEPTKDGQETRVDSVARSHPEEQEEGEAGPPPKKLKPSETLSITWTPVNPRHPSHDGEEEKEGKLERGRAKRERKPSAKAEAAKEAKKAEEATKRKRGAKSAAAQKGERRGEEGGKEEEPGGASEGQDAGRGGVRGGARGGRAAKGVRGGRGRGKGRGTRGGR